MQQLQKIAIGDAARAPVPCMPNSTDAEEHEQFLHIVNHDLKAGLRALAELPIWIGEDLEGYDIDLPGDVQEHLDMMRTCARDMIGLIDGLVDLQKAGRTPDASHRTTVEQAARRAWEKIDGIESFKLKTSEALDTLYLPQRALAAIFKSVLENALHHHDRETGCVTVASETDGERVYITIEDDGPGVPKAARCDVFGSLVMLRRREETGRAGLGLTLVRKLVTKLGGNISLTDASTGRGTAVMFDVPVRARW